MKENLVTQPDPAGSTAVDSRAATSAPEGVAPGELVRLVEKTRSFSGAVGRGDLAKRLEDTRTRLLDPHVKVIVAGQLKQGKSKLVNALITAPDCAVDDDVATAVPTAVGYADDPTAAVFVRPEGGGDDPVARVTLTFDI